MHFLQSKIEPTHKTNLNRIKICVLYQYSHYTLLRPVCPNRFLREWAQYSLLGKGKKHNISYSKIETSSEFCGGFGFDFQFIFVDQEIIILLYNEKFSQSRADSEEIICAVIISAFSLLT